MSVTGVSTSSFFSQASEGQPNRFQQFQKELQQLGQDLQSGNLAAAQSDFASLPQFGPRASATSSAPSTNPIAQAFDQLSEDLQSGNLSAAQQDYSTIQKDLSSTSGAHHHHHHAGSAGGNNPIVQEFAQVGEALSSGDLSGAKQAYGLLQQDLPSTPLSGSVPVTTSGFGVNA